MDPEDIEFLRKFKKNERCIVPSLLKNLEERSLGFSKKNVTSKEHRELFAEELLVEKEKFDELRCEMPGMPRSTFLMVFSPDGTTVASTHGNHNIYITDIRNGKNLKTLVGHPRTPWCIAFHPTSNQIVASGCLGGQVRIWDLSGGSEVWTAKNQTVIASIAFHPIERILAIATSNEVYFWDWSKPVPFLHASTGCQKQKVRYVAFDKLGQRLITGISNSHSRWEYVRSSERSSEHPVRQLNVSSSRRPGFRRGFVPTRQNISSSASNNSDSREAQSRVPERERNITMSYRNLVRQYGRLVQRYLQLYRPPAMIDRGTDPMENTSGTSGTNNLADTQETNNPVSSDPLSVSAPPSSSAPVTLSAPSSSAPPSLSALQSSDPPTSTDPTTSVAVEVQPSTSGQNNQSRNTRRYADVQHGPVNCVTPVEESRLLRKHKSDTPTESRIPQKKIKLRRDDNGDQSIPRSESPQPSTSGLSAPKRPDSKIEELSASILASIANLPTPPAPQEHNRTDNNDSDTNQSFSVIKLRRDDNGDQSIPRSESPQPSTSGLSALKRPGFTIEELSASILASIANIPTPPAPQEHKRTDNNDSDTNQSFSVQTDDVTPNETENQQTNTDITELTDSITEDDIRINPEPNTHIDSLLASGTANQDSNINTGEQLGNTNRREYSDAEGQIENAPECFRESNTQTDNSSFIDRSVPGTSRDDSDIPNEDLIYNQMVRGLDSTPEEITRSRSNEASDATTTESYAIPEELDENLEINLEDSSLVDESVPGTSGVTEERLQTREEPTLENMMMNMRRNAEDNLRARYMPLIQSNIPENEREEIVRLFEESVRESRERARLRYRNMAQVFNRQPTREPRFTSSDSSGSEDERDPLHMNFYIRSRNENSSRTTDSPSGASSSIQRSREGGFPSGNNSYQNINNLESWVTSLFNDVDSPSANANGMSTDDLQTSYNRSSDLELLELHPRNRDNLVSISTTTSSSSAESAESSPNPARNTSTGTTNSTIYSLARRRLSDIRSAFSPTRNIPEMRRARMNRRLETVGVPTVSNPAMDNNFARDEVINFSEFPNSENPAPERPEPFRSSLQESFHPFNPPPNLPAINPENIGIGNMYSNIIHDLEASLNNARDIRTVDRPGEMSNMLSSFSNRLETLMNQSEGILRNLRTSVEVLPDNEPLDYGDEAPVPTANFNDSSFFVRDQRTEGAGSGRNLNSSPGYDIRQNNATSDHTYPRNSDSPSSSSNLNESMSPLMNSLHLTLSHIQNQSRLLHRQVESIERIDRAMIEVSQLQLMRLLLVELSTYVRNRSGESRSTSMSSVRQMMAGTRISDSSPGIIQNSRNTATADQGPSTSSSSRVSNQSSTSRSRGVTRKTYPPSRLSRPREVGSTRSARNSREQVSSVDPTALPSVAPPHTFSQINMSTLLRMERRLQSIIDDHSSRFSYLSELIFQTNNPRRLVHEVGEHNLALRLRESITRTNRLIGNIFNANVVRNYRIDASTSIRHGIERYYERTLLSLIIDGISSHLNDTIDQPIPSEIRTRMQNVLQLAMMLSDLLLLYTIISLAPTSDVNLESERRILARRIAETCSTMIRVRQYRNYSNVFVQSLRSLRLMVSSYCGSPYENPAEPNRRPETAGNAVRPETAGSAVRPVRDRYSSNTTQDTPTSSQNAERGQSNEDNRQLSDVEALEMNPNNTPLINACLYLARRQMAQDQLNPNSGPSSGQAQRARNRANALINTCLYLRRRQLAQESSNSNQNSESSNSQNEDRNRRTNLTTERSGNQNPTNTNQNPETSRPSNFNPYRDMAFITSRSTDSLSTQHNSESSTQNTDRSNQNIPRQRTNISSASEPNTSSQSVNQNTDQGSRQPNRGGSESQIRDQFRSWWERTIENWATEPEGNLFGPFDRSSRPIFDLPPVPPNHSRPSTSNAFLSEAQRYWRIPSVQVNDVPLSDLAPTVENSESDNPINPTTYPRVMARLAAIRSVSVYNHPMGVLRPRLLHPLYATLNPFDADLEQREHIYDSDVISTVTPNHRIQVWDISDSVIPSISDPLKNLVVRECKIHNDASVDIACDGSILVTLLPSGGYLNITNRLGIYSLRWETLGQCLYTTSFVHNAVSVSLSPLGRHLVVGLASRRVSILPNDRWMMASIFKIEEKDTPGDHLPFVRQIDRGTDERATSHKSVNCIRWLPTSGQGLIYATNTGQLNIWT